MGFFGSLPLANKFAIILGALVVLTFLAGFFKVWLNKRKLKKATVHTEIEAARKTTEKAVGPQKYREGDLFGVRAIEHGFYGGVSQSRPATPSSLSQSSTLNQQRPPISPLRSMTPSSSRIPTAIPKHLKHKPTPLRLRPQNDTYRARGERSSPGRDHSPIELSPLSAKSNGSGRSIAHSDSDRGWVSPLDVHFSRPQSPTFPARERPDSLFPRLQYPDGEARNEVDKNVNVVPSPSRIKTYSLELRSEVASSNSGDETITRGQRRSKISPTFSLFPSNVSPRAARLSARSTMPPGEETRARQPSRPNLHLDAIPPPPPIPDADDYYQNEYAQYPWEDRGRAVLRESAVSKHHVSVYQPQRQFSQSPESPLESRARSPSIRSEKSQQSRTRSQSSETQPRPRKHKRSKSSTSITRTHDSLRRGNGRHSRKFSVDRENRRSRDRDQLHYDPHNHHRNRSGSIQGRAVDFDNPRTNPFADDNLISSNRTDKSAVVTQDMSNRVLQMKSKPGGGSKKRSDINDIHGSEANSGLKRPEKNARFAAINEKPTLSRVSRDPAFF